MAKAKRRLTTRQKEAANEEKYSRYLEAHCQCHFCHDHLEPSEAHWAHRINQGPLHTERYGEAVIQHKLNGFITCADCNHLALLNPATRPLEAAELVFEIEVALGLEDAMEGRR